MIIIVVVIVDDDEDMQNNKMIQGEDHSIIQHLHRDFDSVSFASRVV